MRAPTATKWIYEFAEGSRDMRALLGGKGAGIAEMTRVLGPDLVPAGFTITTDACVEYMRPGRTKPDGLDEAVDEGSSASRSALVSASATPRTRCWCPCAAGPATRCRA